MNKKIYIYLSGIVISAFTLTYSCKKADKELPSTTGGPPATTQGTSTAGSTTSSTAGSTTSAATNNYVTANGTKYDLELITADSTALNYTVTGITISASPSQSVVVIIKGVPSMSNNTYTISSSGAVNAQVDYGTSAGGVNKYRAKSGSVTATIVGGKQNITFTNIVVENIVNASDTKTISCSMTVQ